MVAMSDLTDIYTLDDLEDGVRVSIVPVVTTEENLQRMQARVFSTGEQVADILQEATEAEAEDPGELEFGRPTPARRRWCNWWGSILQRAVGEEALDIHLEPQTNELKVRRIDGVLRVSRPCRPRQGRVTTASKSLATLTPPNAGSPRLWSSVRLGSTRVDTRVATDDLRGRGRAAALGHLQHKCRPQDLGFAPA